MTSGEIRIAVVNALRNGPRRKADVLQELLVALNPPPALLANSGKANIPRWQHRILTEVAYLRRAGRMLAHQADRQHWSLSAETAAAAPAITALEGRERLRLHRTRERSGSLRRRKINDVLERTGQLACECCDRDAAVVYGPIGRGYCEVHHRDVIAGGERETELNDLAIVCASCHRILHRLIRRGLPATVADLRSRIAQAFEPIA